MENVTVGLAFIAGFLSFVSPCCLPLVPAYIGYMSGRMTHTVAGEKAKVIQGAQVATRATMLLHGLAFVAGFTFVFVTIGLMTTAFVSILGSTVSILTDIIGRVGGVLIIVFGLHFMGALRWIFRQAKKNPVLLNPITSMFAALAGSAFILWGFIELPLALPFLAGFLLALLMGGAFAHPQVFWLKGIDRLEAMLYSDTRGEMQQRRGGLFGSFVMGIIFSAGWTPCIGPLLGTILTLAANTGDASAAVPLLTAYSLGLGIPFLVAALLMDGAKSILRRLQRHVHKIEVFSGTMLVIVGILVTTGQLASLSQSLSTKFADFSYRLEECGVGFFTGEIQANQFGACINGTLVAVAINQSAAGKLNDELLQMEYVFHVEAAAAFDVEVKGLMSSESLNFSLRDAAGNTLAQRDAVTAGNDEMQTVMTDVWLEPGMYIVVVSRDSADKVDFRVKVRETPPKTPVSVIPATSSQGDSAVADLAAQGLNDLIPAAATPASSIPASLNTITGGAAASAPVKGSSIGERALDFTLTTDTGETITLSDLQGKVVLLNFWGTWCGPCRREMPEFQELYEEYGGKNFEIVAVAVRDTPEAVQQFREEFRLTFPLVLDENNRVNDMYAIPGQPSTFVLDKNGVIVFQSFSVVLREEVEAAIKAALE